MYKERHSFHAIVLESYTWLKRNMIKVLKVIDMFQKDVGDIFIATIQRPALYWNYGNTVFIRYGNINSVAGTDIPSLLQNVILL